MSKKKKREEYEGFIQVIAAGHHFEGGHLIIAGAIDGKKYAIQLTIAQWTACRGDDDRRMAGEEAA